MQECNSVKCMSDATLSLSLGQLCAQAATTLTVTEKIPVIAHGAFLRRMLIDRLEHGDANVQHDPGAQIFADVFDACSAEPESPPKCLVRDINCPFSWNLAIDIDEQRLVVPHKLATASFSVATTTTSSSTKNFVLAANHFVKKSSCG